MQDSAHVLSALGSQSEQLRAPVKEKARVGALTTASVTSLSSGVFLPKCLMVSNAPFRLHCSKGHSSRSENPAKSVSSVRKAIPDAANYKCTRYICSMTLSQMHFKYQLLYKKGLAFCTLLSVVVIVDTTHSSKRKRNTDSNTNYCYLQNKTEVLKEVKAEGFLH